MKAQIITIGDELLIGQTLNSNASFIGKSLTDLQIEVQKQAVIGDDEQEILSEFASAWMNHDLVIVTGGLGPTHDDITCEAVAKFFKCELEKNDEVLLDIKERFTRLNRTMALVNETQAMVPKVASVMRNYYGTAPGLWIERDNKMMAVMPGVPYEMKQMMTNYIIPKLSEKIAVRDKVTKRLTLLTTGIAESSLFAKFGDIKEFLQEAKLAFLPSQFGVKLRLTVTEKDEKSAFNKLNELEQKIRSFAGRYIYGKAEDDLAEVVGNLLKERGLTISVAESCTGGNICSMLTNFSGSSKFLERGVVVYSNAAKVELLNVNEDTITAYGAVSKEVAQQMADGIKSISGTDIGLSITGVLGPTGGSDEKPVGTVFIGICDQNGCIAQKFNFGDDRILNKQRASQAALDIVRKYILGIPLDA
ncbi:MAG: competence/damage-inducible protein A [Ignavibacteriaceae bacterium]|nr:competence/damage-inducible protein A [Ignavibacteriaceae bacterium]